MLSRMSELIMIKGGRDGLRMQFDEQADWPALLDAFRDQLERNVQFFSGAKISIDLGERAIDDAQLNNLLDLMRHHGLEPAALNSLARESRNAARAAGMVARPVVRTADKAEEGGATFLQRTVRSGQIVRHQGHVTIVGDVNPGGEVVAGGSVIVWGRLRGTVHAGALGDTSAEICALEFAPTQLRMADLIARAPDAEHGRGPEVARIVDGQISVASWGVRRTR